MRKLKFKLDRRSLQTIYTSFISPLLEYADIVWDNCNQTKAYELEKIQHEAAQIVTGASKHAISEETDQTLWMSRPLTLEGFKYWTRGMGWGGDANRITAGPLAGHRPLSKLLGVAPAV